MTKTENRGGFRPGSGRKPSKNKKVQIVVTIAPETRDFLKAKAKEQHRTIGRILDDFARVEESED